MSERTITLNKPQNEFINLPHKFRAFVGGYGSSKTTAGCISTLLHLCNHPNVKCGYFAPSYRDIRDVYYESIEKVAGWFGMKTIIRSSDKEVDVFSGGRRRGTIICRSMDDPENIVGFEIGHATVDELDVLPQAKAEVAWRKIVGRMRVKLPGLKNGIDVTTTPEGFRFTYNKFVKNCTESYGIVYASTYDNEANLPDDYISSLIETYPANIIDAYLHGKFVNLTQGCIYNYNRIRNRSDLVVKNFSELHIGQDFNVDHMCSVICVRDENGYIHVVDQLVNLHDTLDLIRTLRDKYKGKRIIIYPDASGGSRSTVNASVSDIGLLKKEGYRIKAGLTNPAVKDRILSVNKALESKKLFINDFLCPDVSEAIEKQSYNELGLPDKKSGFDHISDALGYIISQLLPVIKPGHAVKLNWR